MPEATVSHYHNAGFFCHPLRHSTWVPGDMVIESFIDTTSAGGASSITLGTDTRVIGAPLRWMQPVSYADASPTTPYVSTLGVAAATPTQPAYVGEASQQHIVNMIGGFGSGLGNTVILGEPTSGRLTPGDLVWELTSNLLSGTTSYVTFNTSLALIKRPVFVLPFQIISGAVPHDLGISALTAAVATFKSDGSGKTIGCLWGGYAETAGSAGENVLALGADAFILKAANRAPMPGALLAQAISTKLDGASPSTVTITAANDCEIIRHIIAVIPVNRTTGLSVAWDGSQGPTAALYGQNAAVDVVDCLVIGR